MFVRTFLLTEDQKRKVSEMDGKILLWILEGRSMDYMSKNLKIDPWEIESNIDEILYILLKHVGKKRFLRTLIRK